MSSSTGFEASVEQMSLLDSVVSTLEAVERQVAQLQAVRQGLLSVAGRIADDIDAASERGSSAEVPKRAVAAEIGAALRVSDRTVQRQMSAAQELTGQYPAVHRALSQGRITVGHVRVIVDAGGILPDQASRDAFAGAVLPVAERESSNRLKAFARRMVDRMHPRPITARYQEAKGRRGSWVHDLDDGHSQLNIVGPTALIHGAHDRLTQMAKRVRVAHAEAAGFPVPSFTPTQQGETTPADLPVGQRLLSQLRSDLAVDLLLTGSPAVCGDEQALLGEVRATVAVTVPVLTLMHRGTTDESGTTDEASTTDKAGMADERFTVGQSRDVAAEIDGMSPIDADTAARLAGDVPGWDRVLTDPISGRVLAVDRYRPREQLRRHLRHRDVRCRFPGCGMPARLCDIDHHHDAALGGATEVDNLGDLCRRHHTLKHASPWHVRALPDGTYEWISPAGRLHHDRPPSQNTVTFQDPPPRAGRREKPPPF